MNCPHCQKTLPENYGATYCPFCGMGIPVGESPLPVNGPSLAPVRIRWLVFFAVLLAPALLTLLSSFLGRGHDNENISPIIAIVGGIGAAIACGVMLGLRIGRTVATRVGLSLLFSCVFAPMSVTLCFFGCMVGGYQLQFH